MPMEPGGNHAIRCAGRPGGCADHISVQGRQRRSRDARVRCGSRYRFRAASRRPFSCHDGRDGGQQVGALRQSFPDARPDDTLDHSQSALDASPRWTLFILLKMATNTAKVLAAPVIRAALSACAEAVV